MKILKNNFLTKLIVSLCLFFVLISFGAPSKVFAANDDQIWGGKLLSPVIDLLAALADGVMEILHDSVQEQDAALIQINSDADAGDYIRNFFIVVLAIIVAVIAVAAVLAISGGVAAGAAALALKVGAGTATAVKASFVIGAVGATGTALTTGIVTGVAVASSMIPDDIYLPAFSISAEEIFKNKIALFDINFFNPNKYYIDEVVERDAKEYATEVLTSGGKEYDDLRTKAEELAEQTMTVEEAEKEEVFKTIIEEINNKLSNDQKITSDMYFKINTKKYEKDTETISHNPLTELIVEENRYVFSVTRKDESSPYIFIIHILETESERITPTYVSGGGGTPETNEIDEEEYLGYQLASEEEGASTPLQNTEVVKDERFSTAAQLQGIVSTWYFILRNIALLVLMLLLIYTGIRIVIGSTAGEKAKYKERLMDWLVAMCLIFIMHYIMAFSVELVEKFVDLVSSNTSNGNMANIVLTKDQEINAEKILEGYNTIGKAYDKNNNPGQGAIAYKDENGKSIGDGHGVLIWPTDLAGLFRIQSQITAKGTIQYVGYALCYVVLVLFTLFFAFTYARRVVYMAFLTMIAPLVAMTYPIDKITDGKAQAFDSWLKEYIFNLMIQPLHLLLYTVLINSAFNLASNSPIYALVAMGFMMPAEKLMRRFFGFEKAKTPGLLGGAAGAALAMTGLQKIMGHHGKGKHGSGGNGDNSKADNSKTRLSNPNAPSSSDQAFGGINADDPKYDNIKLDDKDEDSKPSLIHGQDDKVESPDSSSIHKAPKLFDAGSVVNAGNGENAGNKGRLTKVTPKNATPEEKARVQGQQVGQRIRGERKAAERAEAERQEKIQAERAAKREEAQKAAEEKQKAIAQSMTLGYDKAQPTNWQRAKRAIGGVSKAYATNLAGKALKRAQKANPVKAMAKAAAGLAEATLFASAGVALGTAAGDPSKVFQYGSAGLIGGYSHGSSTASSVVDALTPTNVNEIQEEAERGWHGDDYAQVKYEEDRDKRIDTDENDKILRDNGFDTKEEREEFKENAAKYYWNNGVYDMEDMIAIENYTNKAEKEYEKEMQKQGIILEEEEREEFRQKTKEKAIGATRFKNNLPSNIKNMSQKKQDEYRETYESSILERLKKQYSGWETDKKLEAKLKGVAKDESTEFMQLMKKLESQKSDLIKT